MGPGQGTDDEWQLTRLLYRQCDVASGRQLSRHVSPAALRNLVDSGRWQRPHRGVYCAHNGPLTTRQTLWIASLAAGRGRPGLIGGRTALTILGLRGFESDRIHVLLPAGRRDGDPPARVIVHRTTSLAVGDMLPRGRPPTTTIARSLIDAASWARTDREAMTVVAMAFQQQLVGLAEIRELLLRLPRAKRRGLTWTTAADAAGGSHTIGELDLAKLLRIAGLPEPSHQVRRTDADGRLRYLDAYFNEWGVHLEIDGAHHLDPRQAWADADRQNQLWITGDRVLHFPNWLVRAHPEQVAATVRRALEAAGWRP